MNDKKQQQCEYILNEIITTERTFVQNILLTKEVFIKPLKLILDPLDYTDQFSDYLLLVSLHEEILLQFENLGENKCNIIKILMTFIPMLRLHIPYLQNYQRRLEYRKSLLEQSLVEFNNISYGIFLQTITEDKEKQEKLRGRSIESFLIEPVQRIPRYKLLLEQVIIIIPIFLISIYCLSI